MKKVSLFLAAIAVTTFVAAMAGCGSGQSGEDAGFKSESKITVMNRESGSGTKISFLEMIGKSEPNIVESRDNLASGTEVMLAAIESDLYAIGYVSLGALDDKVKAVNINDISPSKENVQNGSYPMVRDFSLVTSAEITPVVQDFLDFILNNGSFLIEAEGFIAVNPANAFKSGLPQGTITIAGSTSVAPLMKTLIDEYKKINPDAVFEINETDSTNGIRAVTEGISQIAMVSRELSEPEQAMVKKYVLAKDGIAVVVNKNNPIDNLSVEALGDIYAGEMELWSKWLGK